MFIRARTRKNRQTTRAKEVLDEKKDVWQTMSKTVPLFPVSKRQHLKYYDFAQTVSTGVGTAGNRFFSCNGCFDPDISGTGHQPMGFDQMMALYDQYTVLGAKISVNFIAGSLPPCVAVFINPDTTTLTSPINLVENGLIQAEHLDCGSTTGGTGQRTIQVTKSIDIAKYFGRPKGMSIVNDAELHGTAAANPVEQAYFVVAAWDYATGAASTVYFDVLLEFDVMFTEPRKLASS